VETRLGSDPWTWRVYGAFSGVSGEIGSLLRYGWWCCGLLELMPAPEDGWMAGGAGKGRDRLPLKRPLCGAAAGGGW